MNIVEQERQAARSDLAASVAKKAQANAEILKAIQRCQAADLTVTEISEICGVTRETIYRWAAAK